MARAGGDRRRPHAGHRRRLSRPRIAGRRSPSPSEMRRAVDEAGDFDLAVNAVSPKGRFGGGDLITTDDDAMSPYLEQLLPEVFAFYRIVRREAGRPRRRHARPGDRRLGAAGVARQGAVGRRRRGAVRALSQAAANELKPKRRARGAAGLRRRRSASAGDDDGGEKIDTVELAKARAFLARAGPQRLDARAGGHTGRRPLDAGVTLPDPAEDAATAGRSVPERRRPGSSSPVVASPRLRAQREISSARSATAARSPVPQISTSPAAYR